MTDRNADHPDQPLEFHEIQPAEMVRRSEEFFHSMNRRRTVRAYSPRAIPVAVMENAIRTASTAPSGAHKQPWHFALIGDPGVKKRIREAAEVEEKESYENRMPQSWLDDLAPFRTDWRKPYLEICPWLVVVFAKAYDLDPNSNEKRKNYYVKESVGIAVGMLLAALHQAGVATLTHTPSPMSFLQEILQRPKNERAFMLIATGFPADDCRVPALARKSLAEVLTRFE